MFRSGELDIMEVGMQDIQTGNTVFVPPVIRNCLAQVVDGSGVDALCLGI